MNALIWIFLNGGANSIVQLVGIHGRPTEVIFPNCKSVYVGTSLRSIDRRWCTAKSRTNWTWVGPEIIYIDPRGIDGTGGHFLF